MKYLLAVLFSFEAFACAELGNQLNPTLKKKLEAYDKFVVSLQNKKDPLVHINKWIKREGILLDAYISERLVKNYPSSFHGESMSNAHTLFLRNLKLPPGLTNDIISEISDRKAGKAVRSWQIPANASFLGIYGSEILYRAYLGTPCSRYKRDVLIAISPNGSFRAIDDKKIPEPKYGIECPGMKKIFDSCVELIDVKSRKKKFIVFHSPIT